MKSEKKIRVTRKKLPSITPLKDFTIAQSYQKTSNDISSDVNHVKETLEYLIVPTAPLRTSVTRYAAIVHFNILIFIKAISTAQILSITGHLRRMVGDMNRYALRCVPTRVRRSPPSLRGGLPHRNEPHKP